MKILLLIYISGVVFNLLLTRYCNKKTEKGHPLYTNNITEIFGSWIITFFYILFIMQHIFKDGLNIFKLPDPIKFIIGSFKKWYE